MFFDGPRWREARLRSTLRFSLAECSIIACGQASYTEPLMANKALINLLDWCKRERENLQCQLDALKAGRFKTHSNDGSGWKDTTQDSIERVEENIWELSKLILNMRQHGLNVKEMHVVRCSNR